MGGRSGIPINCGVETLEPTTRSALIPPPILHQSTTLERTHRWNITQPQRTPNLKEFFHPQGFFSLAKNVGIKDSTLDLTVIYSTVRARAAAVFTRNRFPGAPVIVGRKHIADGFTQALVINSKNANVAMGKQGINNADRNLPHRRRRAWRELLRCPALFHRRDRPAVADG